MGERPVFSTKAHVFQIDPETRKKWIPSTEKPVVVSYYFDSNRKTHRIIAIEGNKVLINSTITANMTFTKTSPKFGQWSDHRANTVYGLGFHSTDELTEFLGMFSEAKAEAKRRVEDGKKISTKQQVVQRVNPSTNGSVSPSILAKATSPLRTVASPPPSTSPATTTPLLRSGSGGSANREDMPNGPGAQPKEATDRESKAAEQTRDELQFEANQLKLALATSKANAKRWEEECLLLRKGHTPKAAAEEEELQQLREENGSMKKELAARGGAGRVEELEASNRSLKEQVHRLEERTSKLQMELEEERQRAAVAQRELQSQTEECQTLMVKVEAMSGELSAARDARRALLQAVQPKQIAISTLLSQLVEVNQQLSKVMEE